MSKIGASEKATNTGAEATQNEPAPHLPMTVKSTKWYSHMQPKSVRSSGPARVQRAYEAPRKA